MPRLLLAILALSLLVLPGCYRRTVATKGLGGVGTRTQTEYRSNTAADRAVDGMLGRKPSTATKYDEVRYDEKR
ncbi:MAG TPA: hypothetical protein VD997_14600 [Phycisphaerales bacterium]|nr:hypothetical protein [Phycisphaerales bacterium]